MRALADRPAFARSLGLIERHPVAFVLMFRFAYGVRAVAPVAIAASDVPVRRFVLLDLVAALIWGPGFALLGYGFGRSIDRWRRVFAPIGILASIGMLVLVVGLPALAVFRDRRRR